MSRLSREGGVFAWRRLSVSAGFGYRRWRDVDGERFLEGKPSSAGKRNADLLDGKYYWYKSKASVSKLCDGVSFCCPLAARNFQILISST